MPTPYSQANADFSHQAHIAAQTALYPNIFKLPLERLSFTDTQLGDGSIGDVLDAMFGIDRIVKVQAQHIAIRQPLSFTVQERFREPKFATYKDITITEWNTKTNMPSELYKIAANIFLYGYYDKVAGTFIDAIAFDVQKALRLLVRAGIRFTFNENPRSGQTFVCITFGELVSTGCVIWWMDDSMQPMKQRSIFDLPIG